MNPTDFFGFPGTLGGIFGTPIVVSDIVNPLKSVQIRFPRSKRKRIRKKWAKNPMNWESRRELVGGYMMNGTLYVDPDTYAKIQEKL